MKKTPIIEQDFIKLNHRLVVTYGTPEQIKLLETWALPHAYENALWLEEYEICQRIVDEIKLRNNK